jgi:hypothetical protein
LRRTCCTWLLAEGHAIEHVRKVMGHADDRMIQQIYDQTTPEDLRRLMLGAANGSSTGWGKGGQKRAQVAQMANQQVPDSPSKDGVADGTRTRNTWSHSPRAEWPISRHLRAAPRVGQVPARKRRGA